ncbi:hypothetical protein Ocin01_17342 [Orchesella cincta]|uniref:Uncharacterized protein n=1 Tax=Orchesella cincta TaxID=48709 RepID=A0A1D2M8S3_ORCCI|nr:hypothetical protein Ocin01_17342 [Orchesella cincta]
MKVYHFSFLIFKFNLSCNFKMPIKSYLGVLLLGTLLSIVYFADCKADSVGNPSVVISTAIKPSADTKIAPTTIHADTKNRTRRQGCHFALLEPGRCIQTECDCKENQVCRRGWCRYR